LGKQPNSSKNTYPDEYEAKDQDYRSKRDNVGYRYFLMSSAIDFALRGFQARNTMSGNEQEVVALVEGNDEAIADFKKLIERQKPEHSLVSNISFEENDSEVMKTGEYAQVCTAFQLNKAIPLLLDMRDDLKAVRKNTDIIPQIHEEIKGMREDIQPGYATQFRLVQADIRAIKERLGMS
jgi:acylphosphatase